ncbi:MAG: ribose-phosphate pyrophosphokinase [Coriobacteriales bacterium]|nr:ribose-phosphate pyrophosphokinase [Coriobacteriales bacterium]
MEANQQGVTMSTDKNMLVFSGTANPALAEKIAKYMGVELGNVKLSKFANGEIYARYLQSVRGRDVYIIQSVAGNVNDALMELLIMIDAAKRASAKSICAVISHYGYSRQDKKSAAREPITAKLVANLLEVAGVDRIIAVDLHQGQIQGFFNIPVNHLTAMSIFADYFKAQNLPNLVVVSPDTGRARAAQKFCDIMGSGLAIMSKSRPAHNKAEVTTLIGDVEGKDCVLNDDMIDTAGTVVTACKLLKDRGAASIHVCATHGLLSGPAFDRIESCDAIDEVVVTDTVYVPEEKLVGKIKVVTVAPLLARAITRVEYDGSVSDLFDPEFAL